MWVRRKWLVLWSLWAAGLVRQPGEEVKVTGGIVRGEVSREGTHISYYAIPYGTVVKRFQAAKPAKWEGVLDASNQRSRCPQRFGKNMIIGKEDCLTLNVYVPLPKSIKPLPVLLFIHGGGFRDGSSSPTVYGPEYLIRHNVILVTINYRLEILGYLCLGIKEAPGNVGMKDQVKAMRWVQNNIRQFGGDPDSVTIFGESAGAASVIYHLVSPMSNNLFNKAIVQSGSAISPWALQREPLRIASLLIDQMGYKSEEPLEIYKILANKTVEELLLTRVPRVVGDVILSENIFVPCMEQKINGVEPFLTEHPYNIIKNNEHKDVPLIIGFNDAEGYMFVGKENDTTIANLNFNTSLPSDLDFRSNEDRVKVANNLEKHYMNDSEISMKNIKKIAKFEGDIGITYPTIATAELLLMTARNPIYMYKFCYVSWMNIVKIYSGYRKYPGAAHADDLFYLFKASLRLPQAYFNADKIERITTMWTNFAKYGDPTPEATPLLPLKWQPTDKIDPRLFVIDTQFSTETLWEDDSLLLLNSTYTKYRRKP